MASQSQRRWVGIDEAGYGPNLGPLVMTAVTAVGPADHALDLWADLRGKVVRSAAATGRGRLRVDDSKKLLAGPRGRPVLLRAAWALLDAVARTPAVPAAVADWFSAAGFDDCPRGALELEPWWTDQPAPTVGPIDSILVRPNPLADALPWRLATARVELVGPERFNRELAESGSKADVHFAAFARLLRHVWADASQDPQGTLTIVRCDKHGGRHFYLNKLYQALPEAGWIEPGVERPELSSYTVRGRGDGGQVELRVEFRPHSETADGLTALASILSKSLRELWMDVFNGFWQSRVPGLKPTAGYPVDAARFRQEIEPLARLLHLPPEWWWRAR